DREALSDGVPEEVINSLTQVSPDKLRVIARTTAFSYKGGRVSPQEVGRDLRVRVVLTGKVSWQDDSYVMQVDLIDVAKNSQLWGEKFTGKAPDLPRVQEQIVGRLADKMGLQLRPKRSTPNSEALALYANGLQRLNRQRNRAEVDEAISY